MTSVTSTYKQDVLQNCSSLLPHLQIVEFPLNGMPNAIFTSPCAWCGCLASHNGYVGVCLQDCPDFCEACQKQHKGKLCDPDDLSCKKCGQVLTEVRISENGIVTFASKSDHHACPKDDPLNGLVKL